ATEQFLRSWGGFASGAGVPSPADKIVGSRMNVQKRQRAATVTVGILDLLANVTDRLFLPSHLDGRPSPPWMTWDAPVRCPVDERKIVICMTGATCKSGDAKAAVSPDDRRHVKVHIIALRRSITCRVAVHASRASDHLCHFVENGT